MCGGTPDFQMPEAPKPVIPVTPKDKPKNLKNRRAAGETEEGGMRRRGVAGLLIPLNSAGVGHGGMPNKPTTRGK